MRNIAIANFFPKEVPGSSWPRFTGWKLMGSPVISSGLFGLIDSNIRMHAFFKDTCLADVLNSSLCYRVITPDCIGSPIEVSRPIDQTCIIHMKHKVPLDTSIRWLPPYQYIDDTGTEWDVYVLIPGKNIVVDGTFHQTLKCTSFWDMGIWVPNVKVDDDWTDINRIEQETINYVVSKGYRAFKTAADDTGMNGQHNYVEASVTREIPPRS